MELKFIAKQIRNQHKIKIKLQVQKALDIEFKLEFEYAFDLNLTNPDLAGEITSMKDEIAHLDAMMKEINGMAETVTLGDKKDVTWRSDCAGALAAGIRDELIQWKKAKQREFTELCDKQMRLWDKFVRSEEEEYRNEAGVWALHRKQLLRVLELTAQDCERHFRRGKAKADSNHFGIGSAGLSLNTQSNADRAGWSPGDLALQTQTGTSKN